MKSRGAQVLGWLESRRLRTHLWLSILPIAVGLLILLVVFGLTVAGQEREATREDLARNAEDAGEDLEATLDSVSIDVEFFKDFLRNEERFNQFEDALRIGEEQDIVQARQLLEPLSSGLRVLLQSRQQYTFVSIISTDGQELLRVERAPDAPGEVVVLPIQDLTDRSSEAYVQEGGQLRRGRIWASDIRLRRDENGNIVEGNIPTVDFVTLLTGSNQNVIALLALQVDVSDALDVVNNIDDDFAFLIDDNGFYLARSDNNLSLLFGSELNGARLDDDQAELLLDETALEEYIIHDSDVEYIAAREVINPFSDVAGLVNAPQWSIVYGRPTSELWGDVIGQVTPFILLGLVVLVLSVFFVRTQAQAIEANVDLLQDGIQRVRIGDLSYRIPSLGRNELGELASAFNSSAENVQNLINDLETSVQDRIRDLDITGEITREVAGLRDVNLVLNRAINLIVERFNFYHAQVFLIDDLQENAILVASTGDPGRRLLNKKHKLGVGSSSVIGRVSALGVTVVAGDTLSTDVPWRPNEELPETRAEMALPLKVEDRVIGALDIQSKRPDAFTPSDIEVFQVLADQLAIAINNARLLEDSNRRVEEIAQLNRRLTEDAWREFATRRPDDVNMALRYDLMDVREDDANGDLTTHKVPITIRGIEVGAIETGKENLSDDEQVLLSAVANRISLAIDNARLFQETQMTLSESRRLYETARTISASADLDLQSIYELITNQLTYQPNLDTVAILIAEPIPSPRADILTVDYGWTSDRQKQMWARGTNLALLQQGGLSEFYQQNPRDVISYHNPEEMQVSDPGYRAMTYFNRQLNANSLIVTPVTTGAKWFGLVVLSSVEARAFDTSFYNFTIAVADQLAIAIENRRLLEDLQNEARRSLALAEAGQLANQISGDFQSGVERLFRSISEPGGFDRWWFGLIQGKNRLEMVTANSPSEEDEAPSEINLSVGNNALAAAVQLRQVILVNDLKNEHPLLGILREDHRRLFGRHLALPVMLGNDVLGALLIGRGEDDIALNEDDIQLATTVASQLSVAIENQNLFSSVQRQQDVLRTTLETMPAGVMLLDRSGQVLLTNQRAVEMLGTGIYSGFFSPDTYPIYYVDTDEIYAREDFPITMVLEENAPALAENVTVVLPNNIRTDLLMSANPIRDDDGRLQSVVAVFQEITELRELERALQASLSETTILYEASRTILGSSSTEELGSAIVSQLGNLGAETMYLLVASADEFSDEPPNVALSVPELGIDNPMATDIPIPFDLLMPDSPLLIEDTRNITSPQIDPEAGKAAAGVGVLSLATMPLAARGQMLGWLVIGYSEPHEFNPEDRRFVTSLADQAAVALDSIRLFESTERALQSVANLYQSSRRVAEAQGIVDVIEVAREELLNFQPDRIDMLLQRSAEDVENMYFAIAWSSEPSLEFVPSLPVNIDNAKPLAGFDLFNRYEYFIENFLNEVEGGDLHQSLYELDTPYQAVVSVPLRVGGRTIGRIGMGFLRPKTFSADDRQLLSTLADSTAYVVENDLLLEQTQESLEETGVLYQASRTIANAETREEIVEALIDYAASAQVDKTMLISLMTQTWDDPGSVIEITATWGNEEVSSLQGLFFTRDQFPIWEQLATSEILWLDDVDTDETISDNARMGYHALGIASVSIVPLKTPTGIIGCIVFGSSEVRYHEMREIRIYQALADQAAVQLENKRLFEQAEFRARQLATSAEVSRAVTSILDLSELFPRVVDLILDAFEYDHVQIFMVDEQRENAVVQASTGEAGRQLLSIKHSLPVGSDSVIGRVTSVAEPVIALDTTDPEVIHRPNPYLPETRSEMAIPIVIQGRVIGALDVQSNKPQAFGDDDIRALSPLVDQLAVAIENARLFEFSQRRAEEMRFLFDVTSAATRETDLAPSLQTVIDTLLDNIDASTANIFLYDESRDELISQVEVSFDPNSGARTVTRPSRLVALPLGEGLVGTTAATAQPIIVEDLRSDPRYFEVHSMSRSSIYVPLVSGQQLVGVIALESNRIGFFDDSHLQLLQALGTSLTAIIRNAQLLEEVRETNERLLEIDQLKTNFLAAMSHELRTPLNSIIGFSRVILKGIDGPLTDMQEQDIQTIHDSGKHLLGLVNDILDQAKIEAGKMELVLDYFDLAAVVNGVMSSAVGLTADKPVRLFTEIEEGLPEAFGDEFRTRQILFNLVSNAAKFTSEGHITVEAKLTHPEGSPVPYVQVSVTDTGIGIAEKDFHHLFEAFQQVDNTTTRSVEGTGLGLPLARSLARLQGGDLWFDSIVNEGSTFYVSVPTAPLPADDQEVVLPVTGRLDPRKANGQAEAEDDTIDIPAERRILAVDDDKEVIDLYKRYLSREGWNVIGTTEPDTVEQLATQFSPEIILLDVNMPNRTGWQVLESLKANANTNKIPVIVCSIDDNRNRSEDLGAANHLVKPFMEGDLVKAVREVETTRES